MVLTHFDLKYVSLLYRKIRQKVPNGKGLILKLWRWYIWRRISFNMYIRHMYVLIF